MNGINVRKRFDSNSTPEAVYDHAYQVLSTLDPPWGLKGIPKKPLPPAAANFSTGVSYTREVGRPVKSYALGFQNRNRSQRPVDLAMNDDMLLIDVRPKMVTPALIDSLLRRALLTYIEALDPYFIRVDTSNLILLDSSVLMPDGGYIPREGSLDLRHGVQRIWQANYWDNELCNRAFGLTPQEIVHRLCERVDHAAVVHNGALIVYRYATMTDDEVSHIDSELRPLLKK